MKDSRTITDVGHYHIDVVKHYHIDVVKHYHIDVVKHNHIKAKKYVLHLSIFICYYFENCVRSSDLNLPYVNL